MSNIEQLKEIVREAGLYMLGAQGSAQSTEKSNVKDFVTVADIKAQNILTERINAAFPGVVVLSEEHPEEERAKMFESDFTGFVMDPIDGTYNFKRDMRESAISVGYIENGEPVFGAIYDPYKDEMYEAVRGEGAKRNDIAISVSSQDSLAGASIATSNSYDDEVMARNLRRHLGIYEKTGVMPWTSCPGSGVLTMAWIACGRIDAYHHNSLKPWDNAAAFLLVQEAGGQVCKLNGQPSSFTDGAILIGNKAVSKALLEVFADLPEELLA